MTIISVSRLSIGISYSSGLSISRPLAIMVAIVVAIGRISMTIISVSRLSFSRPLAIVMTIMTVCIGRVSIAMAIVSISRLSSSNTKNGKCDGNQKIHGCVFLK